MITISMTLFIILIAAISIDGFLSSASSQDLFLHEPARRCMENKSCHPPHIPRRSNSKFRNVLQLSHIPVEMFSNFYESRPFVAAFLICGMKAVVADAVAQEKERRLHDDESQYTYTEHRGLVINNNEKIDFSRSLTFLLYGGLYQGDAQELLFNHVYPILFGSGNSHLVIAAKVLCTNFIVAPTLALPATYLIKGWISKARFNDSFIKYQNDVEKEGLLVKYHSMWLPTNYLAFSMIPEHLIISFMALVSFFWLITLSTIVGKKAQKNDKIS